MEGIRILEVAEHTFVPASSAVLADWGAEVIKIEHAERGDAMRGLNSTGTVGFDTTVNVLFEHSNRGKKSLGLDLADPAGLDILYRLAATADVFLTNKMPGVRERLKIDVDDIRAHNPDIVYVRGSGYGARGPERDAGGYDFLGFWARAGNAMGAKPVEVDFPPFQPAPAYGDSIGAMTIAGGIAAALLRRERTGRAEVVDVSLLSAGMWAMGGAIAISQQTQQPWGQFPAEGRGTSRNPLTGIYVTADGKFLAFSMLQGFHYWPEMCRRVGHEEWIDDPRFQSSDEFMDNAPAAGAMLAGELVRHPLSEWKARFDGMKGQWSAIQDTVEVADDPQVAANGYLQDAATADGASYRLVATPVQFGDQPSPTRRAPLFNEHGEEILVEELGLDWDTVIELKLKGVVA